MRWKWRLLALLFVVVPVVEIYFLVQIGHVIGAGWTVLLLILDGVLGSMLVKREGLRAWRSLSTALQEGRLPHKELADGALVLIGGTLLLTPGFVTDVFALFCILPFTRPMARALLTRVIARRLGSGVVVGGFPGGLGGGFRGGSAAGAADGFAGGATDSHVRADQRPGPGAVVRGEVVDD